MQSEELKPCPFCGGPASIEQYGDRSQSTIYNCRNCSCSLETGEEFDHGTQWNCRAEAALSAAEPVCCGKPVYEGSPEAYTFECCGNLIRPAPSVAVKAVAPVDVYKAFAPFIENDTFDKDHVTAISRAVAAALSAQVQDVAVAATPADKIIGQIEELFPNWRSYRDLVDCITCEIHDLRQRAEGR